jgi:uncharacterized phage protein (TIGR02218 family)
MTLADEYQKSEMEATPELYDLHYGSTHERYTSWSENITFQTNTYYTVPIKRSGFTLDKEFSNVKVSIYAPLTAGFEKFVANAPLEPTAITIYKALESDPDEYSILFAGWVMKVGFRDLIAHATCEASSMILNHETPRIVYQAYCNHELFDGGCGLNYLDYQVSATVTVSGATLSSATFDTYDDGYFAVGRCRFGNDERLITSHSGTDIELHMPFGDTLITGEEVYVYPGCDGSPATCKAFNNFDDHFLGFPYIPSKNPVYWGV